MDRRLGVFVAVVLLCTTLSLAQTPTAVVNGQVRDSSGSAIPNATVVVINDATGIRTTTETNAEGIYSVPNLPPGTYHIQVSKTGFKTIVHPDITLHVQDADAIGFTLPVGPTSDTVTVEGGAPLINTENASVSTVIDRNFAENLPMNGRSFQTLIQLTPGVVVSASSSYDSGQFSISGQRPSSNYWMVDGVSANIGAGAIGVPGNGFGGALGSFSALGGTNSLVSVDALQEFRIQTSTYAPEFGRTPGGQISIATRPGTNQFHGTAFDYLRNDALDANDWFANSAGLPKPEERQNDFGGTFSGPILRDRTFFFFSYEGLRLRLPQVALDTVPDLSARQNAVPAMQPFLNAFPLPNGTDNTAAGVAQLNASYSNPATLDAYSLRVDHKLTSKWNLFGRYNYSPSEIDGRGASSAALSVLQRVRVTTQTGTVGATWTISPIATNDLRFNYSRTNSFARFEGDNFGGAVPLPLASSPLPSPFSTQDSQYELFFFSLQNGQALTAGNILHVIQRQINIVDGVAIQKGSHTIKLGVDFRRLSPIYSPRSYFQIAEFASVPSADQGNLVVDVVRASDGTTLLFRNLGMYAQDTWRAVPRLTVTYGLRWEADFAPSSLGGPNILGVTGFNINNLSNLALASAGTPSFDTRYGNFAPRVGVAYQISQSRDWQTVLRGGFGVFYDLVSSEIGNMLPNAGYPFNAFKFGLGGTFPLNSASAAPPPITSANLTTNGTLTAFDPHLELPYTLEWNLALEQALGKQQTLSASYVGAAGRRLTQTALVSAPNPNIATAWLVTNAATSDYDALQLQFQRHLSRGLQALASYSWSHSIDEASAGSFFNNANALVPNFNPSLNRGPSDFDIRNAFSAGVTYDIPFPKTSALGNEILGGWSVQSVIQAHSAPPVDVISTAFPPLTTATTSVRPDLVPGIPLYLSGPQYPGGKIINNTPGAVAGGCPDGSQSVGPFCPPPLDATTGLAARQGDLGRNALRGFGATQWDFAVHRDFNLRESLRLQFRAEMFNVLNHPNFGPPVADLSAPNFGHATEMLGTSLNQSNLGGGAFNPLYQIGGPRSIQFGLKVLF